MTDARALEPRHTIRDLLAERARSRFVGRERDLVVLETLLGADGPVVLHMRGVPGMGKSRLLDVFAARARRRGATVVRLEAHSIEPTEGGFLIALAAALGGTSPAVEAVAERLTRLTAPVVLAVDAYEELRLLDTWLRQVFVPSLPAHVRVLLVSREPPIGRWLAAPEWQDLFVSVVLEPLPATDAIGLLRLAGIDAESARGLYRFAGGHPLTLTLAAAAARERPDLAFESASQQRVLEQLSREYLVQVEDPLARRALEACAVLRRVTIPLLCALLPDAEPLNAYARLRELPLVDSAPDGLIVQDAFRHAIAANLKSSDPGRYRDYRRAAWRQLRAEVAGIARVELWRFTADMLYLIEDPLVRQTFFPQEVASYAVEPALPADGESVRCIAAAQGGGATGRLLQQWWARAPGTFAVVRDRTNVIVGFSCVFEPSTVTEADLRSDPITAAWCDHLRRAPVEPHEHLLFVRAMLSRDAGGAPSPERSALILDFKRAYMELRPRLRRVYSVLEPSSDLWPFLKRAGFRELPEAAVELDGRLYQSAVLDFGPGSVDGWLAGLVADELALDDALYLDRAGRELVVDERRVALTPLELDLLEYLMEREGQAVSRTALLDDVWHDPYEGGSNVVDVVVRSLRKKLGKRASAIQTVTKVGYRFRRPVAAPLITSS
jgi:DNA-binding winged helix-turn-helix (wHTH) protein